MDLRLVSATNLSKRHKPKTAKAAGAFISPGRGGRFANGAPPKYIINDKGSQFWPCAAYKRWCNRRSIRPRFGAIGKHRSVAVLERAIRTLKEPLSNCPRIPYCRDEMQRIVQSIVRWYNENCAHTTLKGATLNEIYLKRLSANRKLRVEPRSPWPRGSPCALPHALVAGKPGAKFDIEVEHIGGHGQLPVVRRRRTG